MKAVVFTTYGAADGLRVQDVDKPVPRRGQLLIKVRAASVNPIDWHFMRGSPSLLRIGTGLQAPKVRLGRDVAGIVESLGPDASGFRPGDEVFGTCNGGAFAEYVCASQSAVAAKPKELSFQDAAAVPIGGFTALRGLRDKGRVQPGQRVLINGAAGGVGTFAVQLAKVFGAEVTAVCSTRNVDMIRALGAARVIDYTREDFTTTSSRFDLLFDNVQNHSLAACRRILTPHGKHLLIGGMGDYGRLVLRALGASLISQFSKKKVMPALAIGTRDDLTRLAGLMQAGTVKAVIDRQYSLNETADAIRCVETCHARAKVIVMAE